MPAYEDSFYYLWKERRLPVNVDPLDSKLENPIERKRVARIFEEGLGKTIGYVLPLRRIATTTREPRWTSQPWFLASKHIFLIPGDSPIGYRLPLESLPWTKPEDVLYSFDPGSVCDSATCFPIARRAGLTFSPRLPCADDLQPAADRAKPPEKSESAPWIARPALCFEPRDGKLFIFMPPVEYLADYLDLVAAIEDTAAYLNMPVMLEGYAPPFDPRIRVLKVTPDPGRDRSQYSSGRIMGRAGANHRGDLRSSARSPPGDGKIHAGWAALRHRWRQSHRARRSYPGRQRFLAPSRPVAQHGRLLAQPSFVVLLVLGNVYRTHQPASPCGRGAHRFHLRAGNCVRPDSGQRFSRASCRGWRIEFSGTCSPICPATLIVPSSASTNSIRPTLSESRLGLVELRAFEMPPHARMSLTQQLLVRALIAHFWQTPYRRKLVWWGTTLHDRFMLPHFVALDWEDVMADLREAGFAFQKEWFAPHFEFRFPMIGSVTKRGIRLELRHALEPWHVLGEEASGGQTVRNVDSSVERLQVKVSGMIDSRFIVLCNGRPVPLHSTGEEGEFVAGVRYRRGSRHRAYIRTSRCTRRWCLISWIHGRDVRSGVARITLPILADELTNNFRLTLSKRRAGVWRGSAILGIRREL